MIKDLGTQRNYISESVLLISYYQYSVEQITCVPNYILTQLGSSCFVNDVLSTNSICLQTVLINIVHTLENGLTRSPGYSNLAKCSAEDARRKLCSIFY